ncbi:MAG: hypothetical protein H7A37_00310 [Chlamydiales bacterium]|nr:hypothetical protein [Chlamydiia bacterium]MCP5506737.1 hypothetical protein [Chlamydiales bacterium]
MSWQPIDFQRIVSLDKTLVDQLHRFLQQKEAELGSTLLTVINLNPDSLSPPVLPPSRSVVLKLSDAVEGASKKIRQTLHGTAEPLSQEAWKPVAERINQAFWEYEEILEGCVKELFQQLEQLGLEHWNTELSLVLDAIKDLLLHQIEDLIWAIRRMEHTLADFRARCGNAGAASGFFQRLLARWRPVLDRSLMSNLKKSEKFLRIHHRKYAQRFAEYISLDEKVRQIMKKLDNYQVLTSLDSDVQEKFRKIYYFLKLWKHNQKTKILPSYELIRALCQAVSVDTAITLFSDYYQALSKELYCLSRELKSEAAHKKYTEPKGKLEILKQIQGYRSELMTLGSNIARYREFLLRTDPNPYIRTRWGFTEGVVGPEPAQTKKLLNLEYEVETLENLFEGLEKPIEEGPPKMSPRRMPINLEVQRVLHEMGQPLTSYSMTKTRSEYVLEHLESLNELGSFNQAVVEYAGQIFSKVLRADWKYHVLHEIPLYRELFTVHMGIVGRVDDRGHLNRLNKFKEIAKELDNWIRKRETRRHEHEIELDMNDLKVYLQDFLGHVQRLAKDESLQVEQRDQLAELVGQQLLEYRDLFGRFFHDLGRFGPEGKRIRNQLLFVDQYFESVENKLHEIRNRF